MKVQPGKFDGTYSAGPAPAPATPGEARALIAGGDEISLDDDPFHLVTAPLIVRLGGGGFAVIWSDKVAVDGGDTIIEARVYTADGAAIGPAFRVNTTQHSGTPEISAAATADGGFVVSWVDDSEGVEPPFGYTDPSNILARAFDANGTALGPELTVNSGTTGLQDDCRVIGLPGGGFAVAWVDYSADAEREDPWGTALCDIRVQLYGADHSPIGSSFLANTLTEGGQYDPKITGACRRHAGGGLDGRQRHGGGHQRLGREGAAPERRRSACGGRISHQHHDVRCPESARGDLVGGRRFCRDVDQRSQLQHA